MTLVDRRVCLVCIGSELLKGEVLNSNVAFLGRVLFEHGLLLAREISVSDTPLAIHSALNEAFKNADRVITTGGLGPTFDDITREVIADYFGVTLKFDDACYKALLRRVSKGKPLSKALMTAYRRQCFFPRGGHILTNPVGSAAGFLIRREGKSLISLPGVPSEFEAMVLNQVIPRYKKEIGIAKKPMVLTAKAVGINEVEFLRRLGPFESKHIQCGIYPALGELRFTAVAEGSGKEAQATLSRIRRAISQKLKENIYSWEGSETFEQALGVLLRSKKRTVSVAESCTGGLVSKLFTDVPGSSDYFTGSVLAYSNQVKQDIVHVTSDTLKRFGAVSSQTASELAGNIRKIMKSDFGIGVTGIAGPGGGTKQKPVGLVFIAVSDSQGSYAKKLQFQGGRERIRMLAAKWALYLLWIRIKSGHF